jgi:PAS domain S-box-containing protein
MIGAVRDITYNKKLEDELKTSNERFIYAVQATSDAIWDWNISTDEITVGPKHFDIFGHYVNNNTYLNSKWESFIHPDDKEKFVVRSNTAIENKAMTRWSDEYRVLKADGTYSYVNDKAIIIRDDEGKAIRMIGAVRDITYNKKLEDELRQSEAQFKGAFEYSPVGMALVNVVGYYVEVNERLCEILGYSNHELKSLTFQEITYDDDLELDLEYKRQLDLGIISHFSSEKRFVTKNNAIICTYISVAIQKNNKSEMYYIVQVIDITERKKIEQDNRLLLEENNKNKIGQINEAKNRYRSLAENAFDLICLHNLDTSFQYISPSAMNLLGYTPEEMKGKFPLDYVHPDDIKYLEAGFTNLLDEKVNDTTISRFLNKNGIYIWFETKAIITREKGVKTGFQSSSRDITLRKEEEESIKKTLAKERELNELRSNLVSTVSHEFRTPMTTIRTSAELIAIYLEGQNFEKKSRLEKQLNTITDEIHRIVDLMNSVLTISKDDAGKTNFNPIQFDLKQLCLNVIDISFKNNTDGSKVKTYFEGANFLVFADINLMKYSIFNVLNNAFKYSQGSGDVSLKLSASASKVTVQIIDQGIGIPEEDQQKLFNTFFRASNTDGIQGTGLGLYIVKTFTERNSGTVKLESVLGKGTTITLEFPLQKT